MLFFANMSMNESAPIISVIISTYNRQDYIITCLQCLAEQTLSKQSYEVVVVDNNCTDNTAKLVKKFLTLPACLFFLPTSYQAGSLSYLSILSTLAISSAC